MRRRPKGRAVDGWLILDKPVGMTSTEAVARVKRAFDARKAGHAGTLDPLASGSLPIALGQATKTVSYVMEGRKIYEFAVRFGAETATDDREGPPVATSDARPDRAAVEAVLPRFTGRIMQTPPAFSAVKIAGERAYDLARAGESVTLEPREVVVDRLTLVDMPDADTAILSATCGKGTYVRALARDMGRMLGAYAHVASLRRLAVGPFPEGAMVPLDRIAGDGADPDASLLPVEAGLGELPAISVGEKDASRLRRGLPVLLRGQAPPPAGEVRIVDAQGLVAIGAVEAGELRSRRLIAARSQGPVGSDTEP